MNQLMCKNVATACSVVVLAFGLAACSSSTKKPADGNGGTPPANGGTPPADEMDSELKQQQDAAKAAETAAKAASDLASQGMAASGDDPAKTGADAAQTAVMNLVSIQLSSAKAKMYADEAKAAAAAAKRAYDTAAAEAAKAAAATSVVAATEAKRAAEAARKEAEAHAKTANAKARMAVDEATAGIKYADGTYTVGATSIMSGAPKSETGTGEEKKTTGTQGNIEESAHTARPGMAGRAESGDVPERLSQPEIEARKLPVGVTIDSKDDTARLRIIDKYVGVKDVFVYIAAAAENIAEKVTDHAVSSTLPYGALDLTSAEGNDFTELKVHRASGEFYVLKKTDWSNLNDDGSGIAINNNAVESATKDSNADTEDNKNKEIYYVIAPASENLLGLARTKGDRIYLMRKDVGDANITYIALSVRHGVKFPVEMAYEHMNYGTWFTLKAGNDPAGLGIPFVRTLTDVTAPAAMPTSGRAVYRGHWVGQVRSADDKGAGVIQSYSGGSVTSADFGTNGINVTLSTSSQVTETPAAFARLEGTISGNGFAGTEATVLLADVGSADDPVALKTDGEYTGTVRGGFYGPAVEEVGGIFDFTSEAKKHGEFRGAFGGRKVEGAQ